MNRCRAWAMWPIAFTALVLSGCSDQNKVTRIIGDRTFSVPHKNIVEATVFYLPASQNRGLRFVINPEAPRDRWILVSLDPQNPCPSKIDDIKKNSRCRAVAIPTSKLEDDKLRRVSDNDNIWWEYRLERASVSVAACTALAGESDGLCMSHGLYENLPYTVHLRDSEIGNLIWIRKGVERSLSNWEVK